MISHGGMGVVFKARHLTLKNIVAVKVLRRRSDSVTQKRFMQEARLASKIRHPNIVFISDFGVLPDGRSYLVMEYLEGPTLAAQLKQGPLDPLRACRIALQIARGMRAVHQHGIVHRDLKPQNIFLLGGQGGQGGQGGAGPGEEDYVKVIDFGIAKSRNDALSLSSETTQLDGNTQPELGSSGTSPELTRAGAFLGSPRYVAPEQVKGSKDVDGRTDQYALGVMLYQMLAGSVPFDSDVALDLMMMHVNDPVEPPRKRCPDLRIADSLELLVLRMLEKDPARRLPSMREVEQALTREVELLQLERGDRAELLQRLGLGHKPRWVWAVLGVGVLALGAAGVVGYRSLGGSTQVLLSEKEQQTLRQRATQALQAQLGAPELELRVGALAALGQSRDPQLRPALAGALKDPTPAVQAQAAEALGQLGDREATATLLPLLEASSSGAVRVAAGRALDLLGEPRGQRWLQQALDDKDDDLRTRAALSLCERGHQPALGVLGAVLEQGKVPDLVALAILTCQARAGISEARRRLLAMLEGSGASAAQLLIAAKLAQLGEPRGQTLLRERAQRPGPDQLVAARLLAAPDEPATAELFRRLLRDRQTGSAVRQAAAEGLGLSGQLADLRLLGKALDAAERDKDAMGVQAAAGAIVRILATDPRTMTARSLSWARAALADGNWLVRQGAVAVLGDTPSSDAIPLLSGMLRDAEPQVRQQAMRALGRRPESAALTVLIAGLRDAEAAVRQESLRALGRVALALRRDGTGDILQQAAGWFQEVLTRGEPAEQALARGVLLQLGDEQQRAALTSLGSAAPPMVRSLIAESSGGDVALLVPMMKDPDLAVRWAAARALAEQGDRRALPVLDEVMASGGADAIAAYGLLRRLGVQAAEPKEVSALLTGPSTAQRMAALEATARMPAELARPLLLRAARDAEPLVRRLAAEIAAELAEGPSGDPALDVLRVLVQDVDAGVRARSSVLLARVLGSRTSRKPVEAAPTDKAQPARPDQPRPQGATPATPATPATTPGTAPVDGGPAARDAGAESEPGPASAEDGDKPQGRGFLVVDAPALVQFQIDHRPWQSASGQPIALSAGTHRVTSLGGAQEVTIVDKETATLRIEESNIEELARKGMELFASKDLRKAQKMMEKANSLCARAKKAQAGCAYLSFDLSYRLAGVYEQDGRTVDAMTEYQKLSAQTGQIKGKAEEKAAIQEAIIRLAPRLGQVILAKTVKGKCHEQVLWVEPGSSSIEIDGEEREVRVKARETVRLGACP
jgi:HEAT repeat protein/tRNA A-37 threonylcarbamoyl transferase component Bud32